MSSPTLSSDSSGSTVPSAGEGEPADRRLAFRSALARYQPSRLGVIVQLRKLQTEATRASILAAEPHRPA